MRTAQKALHYCFYHRAMKNVDQSLAKLLHLVGGDKFAVKRLVNAAISRHPGKSAEWVLDKVIGDLERDRRY